MVDAYPGRIAPIGDLWYSQSHEDGKKSIKTLDDLGTLVI